MYTEKFCMKSQGKDTNFSPNILTIGLPDVDKILQARHATASCRA
jgi:hypothetical protein